MQALAITIASEGAGLANFRSRLIPAQGLDEFRGISSGGWRCRAGIAGRQRANRVLRRRAVPGGRKGLEQHSSSRVETGTTPSRPTFRRGGLAGKRYVPNTRSQIMVTSPKLVSVSVFTGL